MSISIRPYTYRGKPGFIVGGRPKADPRRSPRVFTESRSSAEHIKVKMNRLEEITTEDFQPQGTP